MHNLYIKNKLCISFRYEKYVYVLSVRILIIKVLKSKKRYILIFPCFSVNLCYNQVKCQHYLQNIQPLVHL